LTRLAIGKNGVAVQNAALYRFVCVAKKPLISFLDPFALKPTRQPSHHAPPPTPPRVGNTCPEHPLSAPSSTPALQSLRTFVPDMSSAAAAPQASSKGQSFSTSLLRFWPDFYGERSFFAPRYRTRTSIGGCVTVSLIVLVSVLFVYTWIEFFASRYFLSSFGTLHTHSLMAVGDKHNVTALRNLILPTLSLFISAASRTINDNDIISATIIQSPTGRVWHQDPEFTCVARLPLACLLQCNATLQVCPSHCDVCPHLCIPWPR